jgi:hypothetical protein
VTINDYPGPKSGSAYATGPTFGLAGTEVTDKYYCEVQYKLGDREPVTLAYERALISTIGVSPGPPGLTPYPLTTAVDMMYDQLAWSVMRDLSARHATEQ